MDGIIIEAEFMEKLKPGEMKIDPKDKKKWEKFIKMFNRWMENETKKRIMERELEKLRRY